MAWHRRMQKYRMQKLRMRCLALPTIKGTASALIECNSRTSNRTFLTIFRRRRRAAARLTLHHKLLHQFQRDFSIELVRQHDELQLEGRRGPRIAREREVYTGMIKNERVSRAGAGASMLQLSQATLRNFDNAWPRLVYAFQRCILTYM